MLGLVSPDGIRWRTVGDKPLMIQQKMDSGLDLGFWDSERKQYVAYIRDRPGVRPVRAPIVRGLRSISLATSSDFLQWTGLQFIDLGDAPLEHFYTGAITPYFRAPHIYLAFPKRFIPPPKNRSPIRNQQQPTQKAPCTRPMRSAPRASRRQWVLRNASGDRQWRRQACLIGVSW